ncbi:hypothetical protein [Methanobrevibacter sp.]|uniref:hypothetical protein n=1 Tax=Methanobrevibacter sp. TaxID=66852 RepID=UPI00388F68E0
MKKLTIKIGEEEHLYTGDVSIVIGNHSIKILEFGEDQSCKESEILRNGAIVTINNWKED